MSYLFKGNDQYTLGVEIELQLVDADTFELVSKSQNLIGRAPDNWSDKLKPELMQCYCEFNTDVCRSVGDVYRDLSEKLEWGIDAAAKDNMHLVWGGTHAFSPWYRQSFSEGERYAWLTQVMQDVCRRLVAFGLHVHIGVDSGDKAIQLCDRLLRHLPTLLALSANSPLWNGRDTGLRSYRSKIMEALPTAGLPQAMRNWSEYVWLIDHLRSTGFIHTFREIWWDVRPHHEFGTVEIRVMDMPLNMKHLLALVALTQSLVAAISAQIDRGAYLYDCHPMIAKQNKWHAVRYGMEAVFVDPDTMLAVPARQTVIRLVDLCRPFARQLGCESELGGIEDILEHGTGAKRQLSAFNQRDDAKDVVKYLIEQSESIKV